MSTTFKEMEDMYRGIVKRFNKIELQPWNAEGAMIELMKQVGELSKQVMIKEKYYAFRSIMVVYCVMLILWRRIYRFCGII